MRCRLEGREQEPRVLALLIDWVSVCPFAQFAYTCIARRLGAAASLLGNIEQAKAHFIIARASRNPRTAVYQRALNTWAAGIAVTLHFPIQSIRAWKSCQFDMACSKWFATPASDS